LNQLENSFLIQRRCFVGPGLPDLPDDPVGLFTRSSGAFEYHGKSLDEWRGMEGHVAYITDLRVTYAFVASNDAAWALLLAPSPSSHGWTALRYTNYALAYRSVPNAFCLICPCSRASAQ